MSTITDVARVAGVSVATVSRALRGLDRVSPETRRRVLDVAEQLHYVASPTATSLASGRTNVVGVVVPYLTRWYFARLVSGIEKGLRDHGHHVLLFDLESETYEERRPLTQNMLWKRVDGIITLNLPLSPDEVELVARLGLPLVAVGPPVAGSSSVRIDDTQAQQMAVHHLIDLGHERIGYVGAVASQVAHLKTPQDRLKAFEATMADAGLAVDPQHVLRSDWTAGAAARDCKAMLERPGRPTAVAAGSDEMAIGVRETARHLGLRVPEDLSIVGIDDYLLSEVLDLTTVRQDVAGQGKLAAELLLTSLDDREAEPTDVVWPIELVVRGSTAPPPPAR